MKISRMLLISLCFGIVAGCGSTAMNYQAQTDMSVSEAIRIIDKQTMLQHRNWKPDFVVINDDFIGWGFGSATQSSMGGAVIGPVVVGSGSSRTREVADRLYFEDIEKVQLLDWKRKLKQWYAVSVITKRGNRKHVLRTPYKEDAMAYVDAFTVLLEDRRKQKNKE